MCLSCCFSGSSSGNSVLDNTVQCVHITLYPCEVFRWNWAKCAAAKSTRLICNLNWKAKWDRNSLKGICKHGSRYSVSGTTDFSVWFQTSYFFTIFIYSSVKEDVIIIYLSGSFNGSLVCFQRAPWQLRQTSIHANTNFQWPGPRSSVMLISAQTAVSASSAGKPRVALNCPISLPHFCLRLLYL